MKRTFILLGVLILYTNCNSTLSLKQKRQLQVIDSIHRLDIEDRIVDFNEERDDWN